MKTKQTENFLSVPYYILADTTLSLSQKLILSFLKGFQAAGKTNNYTQAEAARILGISLSTYQRDLVELTKRGYIFKTPTKNVTKKKQYKNRKSVILIDEKHPAPVEEEKVKEPASTMKVVQPEEPSTQAEEVPDSIKSWIQEQLEKKNLTTKENARIN